MKDLCAACGTDLRLSGQKKVKINQDDSKWAHKNAAANLQAVHNIPELLISSNEADKGTVDESVQFRIIDIFRKIVIFNELTEICRFPGNGFGKSTKFGHKTNYSKSANSPKNDSYPKIDQKNY